MSPVESPSIQELQQEVADRQSAEAALRGSEERYRHLFESLPDPVFIESEGTLILMNPAAERLFGGAHPAELIGTSILDRVPWAQRERTRNRIRCMLDGRMEGGAFEDRWMRLDGRPLDVEVTVIPFTHRGVAGSQIIARDITKRKEMERLKNEFISTVSHELRTPLTSIHGSLGLIAGGAAGVLPASARPLLEIASNNCRRLVRLIDDILDLEKIEAGKMEFHMKPVELMPLVAHALEANRGFGDQYGVRFDLARSLPGVRVLADPDRLMQVLANLLSNAAKFSTRGETVEVAVDRSEDGLRLSVADRGPGIPEAFRPRIFQKFAQADSSDTRQRGGTGLGLAICKLIVERHGGTIEFESESGRGTTFVFHLPEYKPQKGTSSRLALNGARVLVVGEDMEVASTLARVLLKDGFLVDVAPTAEGARAHLGRHRYDAVTLDARLPAAEAAALLREIRTRERTRGIPVVAISAVPGPDPHSLEGQAIGLTDRLEKPSAPRPGPHDQLCRTIKSIIMKGGTP